MSVQGKPAAVTAWIFDWDGIFVDSELWKAWSYGLGICEIWEDFERLEASRFDRILPAADDPFLRVCGRFVGRSREEYLEGLIEYYDLCGYAFKDWLEKILRAWRQNAPDRIAQVEREHARAGTPAGSPILPRDVLFELRRPWFDKVVQRIEPIESNIRFLKHLPASTPVGLVTRTPEDRVRRLMAQFEIPVDRFGKLTCVAERSVTKAQMYELTAQALGVPLEHCAAVEDTDIGVTDARAARAPDGSGMGLVIACPTAMTEVQPFTAADLIVRTGLSALLTLMA
jgi:beta-phosphoglucomutase-like phosphatase (HAD superfamily)